MLDVSFARSLKLKLKLELDLALLLKPGSCWLVVGCMAVGRAGGVFTGGTSVSGNAVVCFVSFAKTINDATFLGPGSWALQLLKLKRKK